MALGSFIFSLENNDGISPFKCDIFQFENYAINGNSEWGPTFGGGFDLRILSQAPNPKSSANLGSTYQAPSGYIYYESNTQALLAGSLYFIPTEVEVFYQQ